MGVPAKIRPLRRFWVLKRKRNAFYASSGTSSATVVILAAISPAAFDDFSTPYGAFFAFMATILFLISISFAAVVFVLIIVTILKAIDTVLKIRWVRSNKTENLPFVASSQLSQSLSAKNFVKSSTLIQLYVITTKRVSLYKREKGEATRREFSNNTSNVTDLLSVIANSFQLSSANVWAVAK